jgi:hypothetical protein
MWGKCVTKKRIKRSGVSYLQMTMKVCREAKRSIWKTEIWNSYAHIRQDLFGFIDAVALDIPQKKIVAIQSTNMSGRWPHINKILGNPDAKLWLQCGGMIEVWCWRQLIAGKRKNGNDILKWTPQIDYITVENFK